MAVKGILASVVLGLCATAGAANAQSADVSPTILIETMPSDNSDYRRVIVIHYANGTSYRAYNRAEFKRHEGPRPNVSACSAGQATSLGEIRAYEKEEQRKAKRGQSPEARSFCIKNVGNWKGGNQATYLDPIFSTLPTGPKRL